MTTILAIVNQKGGVGKTTTAINLAAWFAAQRHMRVALVDFDVQGHAARCLGMEKSAALFRWLAEGETMESVAIEARPGLRLVASDKTTERIKLFLQTEIGREYVIGQRLEAEAAGFDLVVLDLAPGSDLLHVGALVASDYLIIPAKLDFLALDGVVEVIRTVRSLSNLRGVEPPQLIGVLPTMFDRTTQETRGNLDRLREVLGSEELVLPPVPMDTKVREASSYGKTIWEYAPTCAGAIGYEAASDAPNRLGRVGGYEHLGEIVERVLR